MAAKILARIERAERRAAEEKAKREQSKTSDGEIRDILSTFSAAGYDLCDITRRALEPTKDHKLNESLERMRADLGDLLD